MKKLPIIFLALLIFGCTTSEKLKQTTQQIKVDGISADWPQLVHYNKDLGIIYGVAYDNSHLADGGGGGQGSGMSRGRGASSG
jgi:hypothetical protein